MASFGGAQRSSHRLLVAHLSYEDDVGVLAKHYPHGRSERVRVEAHFALVNGGEVVSMQHLDRVLDRHDVTCPQVVDVVDHRCQRCRLARSIKTLFILQDFIFIFVVLSNSNYKLHLIN